MLYIFLHQHLPHSTFEVPCDYLAGQYNVGPTLSAALEVKTETMVAQLVATLATPTEVEVTGWPLDLAIIEPVIPIQEGAEAGGSLEDYTPLEGRIAY